MSEFAGAPVRTSLPCGSGLRQRAARFWLRVLFYTARRAPWIIRGLRGFFLWSAWTFSRYIRETTLANMRRILGDDCSPQERQRAARRSVGSFYDFVYDVGRSSCQSREQIAARITSVEGRAHYDRAREMKQGAIVATAHMGSFEVGMASLLQLEKHVHVVFHRDGATLFESTRAQLRRRLGVAEVPVDEGVHIWLQLRDALLADEVVAIQADRIMPGQKGVCVPFLGGHMMLPSGPVKLAMATGSPIVPIFTLREPGGGIRIAIEEPIIVQAGDPEAFAPAMAKLAASLAKYVKAYPDQWLVLQKAWCEDAPGVEGSNFPQSGGRAGTQQ